MKKTFIFILGISVALMASAEIRVLSNVKLGEGYFPRFADAETVTYLATENADYVTLADESALRVDNENLDLDLYRNGEKVVLKPHGDVNYIWSSLSPDQTMILFNTKFGTAVCDLNGKEITGRGTDTAITHNDSAGSHRHICHNMNHQCGVHVRIFQKTCIDHVV